MKRWLGSTGRVAGSASAFVLAVCLGVLGAQFAPQVFTSSADAQEAISVDHLANGAPMSFADLIEQVGPAVVSVNVKTELSAPGLPQEFDFEGLPEGLEEFFRQFQGPQPREGYAQGSGFFISPDGYIVTNNHVVASATEVTVALKGGDQFDAEVIGVDEPTDLAVLKVENDEPFAYVEFANSDPLRVGDWVVAVGNPFGYGGTATAGIVSGTGREIGGQYNDFIQIDAPINRGNSGGPTFNLQGHVVGVNSQIASPTGGSVGIGFAIPAESASRVVSALIEEGRVVRGWLGVTIDVVSEDVADSMGLGEARGAIVNEVMAGSPAEKAGFEAGDIVLELDGDAVDGPVELTRMVGALRVDERVRFRVFRDNRERTINVTIGERPSDQVLASRGGVMGDDADGESAAFGLALAAVDEDTAAALELDPGEGVLVRGVAPSSDAAGKLKAGDVILEVQGTPVNSPAEFDAAIDAARESDKPAVRLYVRDQERLRFVGLRLTADG